jgi:dGTPase
MMDAGSKSSSEVHFAGRGMNRKHPMDWQKLLSSERLGHNRGTPPPTSSRSPFEADIDRITFSSAFRRLGRKTQVHPLAANDNVHTRLTHSLEVAQVGRTLGKKLGLELLSSNRLTPDVSPNDLAAVVQAACLAHDIGNPPFGHAGEAAISHWFEAEGPKLFGRLSKQHKRDLVCFDGNAQGFRVLTQISNHLFTGGLQLTYATLGAFLKYPWDSRAPSEKFSVFLTEANILEAIAKELGLAKLRDHAWSRHPLAYLVEAADDICYGVLDLEDAVELRILSFRDVETELLDPFDSERKERIRNGYLRSRNQPLPNFEWVMRFSKGFTAHRPC